MDYDHKQKDLSSQWTHFPSWLNQTQSIHQQQLCHSNIQLQTEANQSKTRTRCDRLKNARTLCKRKLIPRLRWVSQWRRLTMNPAHALLLNSSHCPESTPTIDKPWITPSNRKTTPMWECSSDLAAQKSSKRNRNCYWRARHHLSVLLCGQ